MSDTSSTASPVRTYLFALVDGGGTVPPELGAVRRLVERGHDVTVLAEDSMADEVVATGAALRRWTTAPNRPTRLAEDDPTRDWECKNPLQLFDRLLDLQFVGPAPAYANDVDAAIAAASARSRRVFDVRTRGNDRGRRSRDAVRHADAEHLPASRRRHAADGARSATGTRIRREDTRPGHNALTERSWAKGLPAINDLRRERGLAPLARLWDQAEHARRKLVMTSTAFDFPATMPDNVRYVGPVLDDPTWATDDVSAVTAEDVADQPLVLVAMSSTYQDQQDSIQRVVDALGGLLSAPSSPPGRPSIRRPSNTGRTWRSSDRRRTGAVPTAALVVTHGGHGTVIKSLAAGVPLVILPHGRDQADNAARIVARHAGLKVARTAKPSKVAAAISAILEDPSYAGNAQALGETIRRDARAAHSCVNSKTSV